MNERQTRWINFLGGKDSLYSSATNVFVILFMMPVILFFLLKDGSKFIDGFMDKIPPNGRKDIYSIIRAIDTQVGELH